MTEQENKSLELIQGKWTLQKMIEVAKSVPSRSAFHATGAYRTAKHKGVLDLVLPYVATKTTQWDYNKVLQTTLMYATYHEWSMEEAAAYKAAQRHKWTRRIKAHFRRQAICNLK